MGAMEHSERNEQDDAEEDPDVKRLREKSAKGAVNVVGDVLNDPRVQKLIKQAFLRETIKNVFLTSCLFLGLIKLYDVAKAVLEFNWVTELAISLVLIAVGLIYVVKQLFHRDSSGN